MAIGTSNRIVIEIDPNLKEQMYAALRTRGLTLKEWFTQQVFSDLVEADSLSANHTPRHTDPPKKAGNQ